MKCLKNAEIKYKKHPIKIRQKLKLTFHDSLKITLKLNYCDENSLLFKSIQRTPCDIILQFKKTIQRS